MKSAVDPKRILLITNLLRIILLVDVIYGIYFLMFASAHRTAITFLLLSFFIALPLLLLLLVNRKWVKFARLAGLFGFNVLIFFVATTQSSQLGYHFYFMAAAAAAVAVYSYEERRWALGFIALSATLFILVNMVSFDFLPSSSVPPAEAGIFFVFNTVAAVGISIYCIFVMMALTYQTEKDLLQHRQLLEARNRELTKSNKELDRFVYSASHDLRAPLMSIDGLLNLYEMGDKVTRDQFISMTRQKVRTMDGFIKDITHFSRNARTAIKTESVVLRGLVAEIVSSIRFTDRELRVEIVNEIPGETTLATDLYRVRIILSNLITNSLKYADYTKPKPFVRIGFKQEENSRVICIEDNGIGIEPQHQDKIFDMFYRATAQGHGSGLGLYIVKEAVDKLGGSIHVTSKYGQGSYFCVRLPVYEPASGPIA